MNIINSFFIVNFTEEFAFRQIDPLKNADDKKLAEDMLAWNDTIMGLPFNQGKVFK